MGKMKAIATELEEAGISANEMSIDYTLVQRGNRYGEYRNVAETAQMLKNVCHTSASWPIMEPYMQESLDLICNKLARICNGDPFYHDSWHDVSGYARLVEIELEKL